MKEQRESEVCKERGVGPTIGSSGSVLRVRALAKVIFPFL